MDLLHTLCSECEKGTLEETSIQCDWHGCLHCTNCGAEVQRHTKKEIEVSNFQEASFTNHLGQVINVGDQVITVSTGYCNTVHVRKGMYLGRRGNNPTVQVIEDAWGYVLPNGNVYPHKSPEAEYKKYTRTRRTTFPRGRVYLTR